MNDRLGDLRIIVHLGAIEPDPDDAGGAHLRGEMGAPAAHHIEDGAAGREQLRVDLADLRDRAIIYMDDEAGGGVEILVLRIIDTAKKLRFKVGSAFFLNLHGYLKSRRGRRTILADVSRQKTTANSSAKMCPFECIVDMQFRFPVYN